MRRYVEDLHVGVACKVPRPQSIQVVSSHLKMYISFYHVFKSTLALVLRNQKAKS